jgi:hypothetical protein
MSDGMYLSWEEVQRLALPPNTTMLIPPLPEQIDVPALDSGSPPRPDWLEDGFVGEQGLPVSDISHHSSNAPADPEAERAAIADAERAKYGPGAVRLLANMIAMNALIEYANSPAKKEDEEPKPLPADPDPFAT